MLHRNACCAVSCLNAEQERQVWRGWGRVGARGGVAAIASDFDVDLLERLHGKLLRARSCGCCRASFGHPSVRCHSSVMHLGLGRGGGEGCVTPGCYSFCERSGRSICGFARPVAKHFVVKPLRWSVMLPWAACSGAEAGAVLEHVVSNRYTLCAAMEGVGLARRDSCLYICTSSYHLVYEHPLDCHSPFLLRLP